MISALKIYLNRRMLLMLAMGFSSGLPLALTAGTLQAWMTDSKVDLTVIGFFSLVGLPYTLKFLWAPLMDRFVMPFLGRRRSWLFLTQALLLVTIAAMGQTVPGENLPLVAALALAVAFLSASQDIVIDAYRTEYLQAEERGAGAAISNLGYRVAMLTSGAIALMLADVMPWSTVYAIMGLSMLVGVISTLLCEEPVVEAPRPRTLLEAVVDPFRQYFSRRGSLEIFAFVVLYKVDIVMAVSLTTPFMMELGFSKTEIGAVTKTVGMIAAIAGSLVGGGLFAKLGMRRSLWMFGLIQGFSTLSFAALAEIGYSQPAMAAAVAFENFCSGLATAPFIAFLMALCDKRFTATQYALLSSLAAVSRVIFAAPCGKLVEYLGWTQFFIVSAFAAIPALLLLYLRYDRWNIESN